MEQAPSRAPLSLILCVAAGIGVLGVAQLGQGNPIAPHAELPFYTQAVALVVALIAWHLFPRRSWTWLTVAGSLCAIPILLLLLEDADLPEDEWWYEVIAMSARPLLIVGLLGAATLVWRAGHRKAGAALTGAVLTVPMVGTVAIWAAVRGARTELMVVGLALVALTVVLAVWARNAPESAASPGWRVTLAGAVAWVALGVHQWWPEPDVSQANGTADLLDQLKGHFVWVGLVLVGVGLVAGLVAGPRVLMAGLAGGLLLGSVTPSVGSAMVEIRIVEVSSFLPPVVVLVALAAGVLLARARARAILGAVVLGALAVGLLVVHLMADTPSAAGSRMTTDLILFATIPLAIIAVAAVPVFASLGSTLAQDGAAPAALVGVAAAIGSGVSGIVTYAVNSSPVTYGTTDGYPALMVGLVVVAVVTVVAARRWDRDPVS